MNNCLPLESPLPHQKKKHLILHKLEYQNPEFKSLQKNLDKILNDPSLFFASHLNGQEIIIGKKAKNKFSFISQRPNNSNKRNVFLMKLQNNKPSQKSNNIRDRRPSSQSSLNLNLPPNKRYIEDKEIKEIYNVFEGLKTMNARNSTENIKIGVRSPPNETFNKALKSKFDLERKVLSQHDEEWTKANKISDKLSFRTNRPVSNLLMTTAREFRFKKEIKDEIAEEMERKYEQSSHKWASNLRDKNDHYINCGSELRPKWQWVTSKSCKKCREVVRDPEKTVDFYRTTSCKFVTNNNYWKDRWNPFSYNKYEEKMNKTTSGGFNALRVRGRDLLEVEKENTKLMKGMKILTLGRSISLNTKDENQYQYFKDEVFCENIDMKAMKRCKGK